MGLLDTFLGKPQQPGGGLLSMLPDWMTGADVKPVPIEQFQNAKPEGYRQKTGMELAKKLGGGDPYKERAIYSSYVSGSDFVPLLGEDVGVKEAGEDFAKGNYGAAGLGMAGTLLGVAPVVGDLAATPLRAGAKALRAADNVPTKGLLGDVAKTADAAPARPAATVGDINNPDVLFEGVSPHSFKDTAQWHRFGKEHGVENLGSADAAAWEKSLVPYTSKSGKTFTVPGGVDSTEPFTYYDLLHMKQQGINPNDMPPEMHQKIHDRMVKTMSPEGEVSPERLFNQLSLAQISPNQPLTPNELAVARSMAKNPEDLKKWGEMVPWRHDDVETPKQIMKNEDGSDMMRTVTVKNKKTGETTTKQVPVTMRKFYGDKIANDLGLGAGSKGGLGARGTADYTRIAETAQRINENPDFFRFRGAGEGAPTSAGQWANFVERLTSQTPGLSAKTGSFGAVWQNPAMADISAVDRHMAGLFTEEMFPSKEAFNSFADEHVAKFNASAPKGKQVKSFKQLPDGYKNDAMFGYLNQHPDMVLRGKKPAPGSNSGLGVINPKVPAHLRPENADWVSDPKKVQLISDAYKRVLEANAARANTAGQSTFSNQWMLWDRIRNRLEPHEIMFPGLEKLPRMSMDQMHTARTALADAGYMSGTKEIDELTGEPTGLQAVRPLPSASSAGYFGIAPLGLLPMLGQEAEDKPARPGPRKDRRRMRRREEA